jgi:hypothetical protein
MYVDRVLLGCDAMLSAYGYHRFGGTHRPHFQVNLIDIFNVMMVSFECWFSLNWSSNSQHL